ncbi:hypothetical protein NP603_01425 [Methylomonas sp. SURF-1]|uniref:N-acetyltransferase domain-containing protein n=1 Tax=Methylomonas aurea TaxID=2952224 RepID=A0ABT1UCL2_9GAMM|nr:hypothetical protein [Methylomonas sp. SURF-1]MCQ8179756.1 hypothetical protein [Methylomonas sp. SURF-1]
MERLLTLNHPQQLADFPTTGVLSDFQPSHLILNKPDQILLALDENQVPLARCSLWWTNLPSYGSERLGYIGHYAASSRAVSDLLLRSACRGLAAQGCTLAIGPIDGNTWHHYRFVTEPGNRPPFFLEPFNPAIWPQFWLDAGFSALAGYTSAISTELGKSARDLNHAAQRFTRLGIKVRQLQMTRYERELSAIYRISVSAFANNFLYTPLAENEFLDLYAPIKAYIRPEMVLLAEDEQGPLAFLFTVPDILQRRRGEIIDTAVIKTVAAIPSSKTQGLGAFLVAQAMPIYHDLGYRCAIHALMHEHNASRNVSRHQANVQTIRRYSLFAKHLGSET